jgi:hypothetical protein
MVSNRNYFKELPPPDVMTKLVGQPVGDALVVGEVSSKSRNYYYS